MAGELFNAMKKSTPYFVEFRGDSPCFFVNGKTHRDPESLILQDGLLTDDWLFQKMFLQNAPKQTVGSKLLGQKIVPFLSIPLYAPQAMKSALFEATERLAAKESYLIFSATAYCAGDENLQHQRLGLIDVGKYKTSLTLMDQQVFAPGVNSCRVLNLGAKHLEKYSEYGDFKSIFSNALLAEALVAFEPEIPVRIIGESLEYERFAPLQEHFPITIDSGFLDKIFAGLQHIADNMPRLISNKPARIEEGLKEALEWERMIRGEG